jgi:hypothetical protein
VLAAFPAAGTTAVARPRAATAARIRFFIGVLLLWLSEMSDLDGQGWRASEAFHTVCLEVEMSGLRCDGI